VRRAEIELGGSKPFIRQDGSPQAARQVSGVESLRRTRERAVLLLAMPKAPHISAKPSRLLGMVSTFGHETAIDGFVRYANGAALPGSYREWRKIGNRNCPSR